MARPFKPGLIPVTAERFPILTGSLVLEGPRGTCFHRAVALSLDWPAAKLCIGTVRAATAEELAANPKASPVRFIHAWTEVGGCVLAPTLIGKFSHTIPPFLRASYYAENGVRDVVAVPRARLLKLAAEHGWVDHLRWGKPIQTSFGAVLLDAAGVAWKTTPEGGVIPA